MDSLFINNKNQDVVEEEEMSEREVGPRIPRVTVERLGDCRPRSKPRELSGDRDRSPIRGGNDGEGEVFVPLPSASGTSGDAAGEAEATRSIKTRSGKIYTPAPEEEDDPGELSDASVDSIRSARSTCSSSTNASTTKSSRKKRGRPPTTGEYVGLAEAKRQYAEACEAEDRVLEVEAILDPSAPIRRPSKGSKPLPDEGQLARDFRQRPTADVTASVLESQQEVERIASVSKGLQGGFVRALRIAARNTRMAVTELATRSATSATKKLEEENHLLQQQVARLTAEVARLSRAMEDMRPAMPPPPPPPQLPPQPSPDEQPPAMKKPRTITPPPRCTGGTQSGVAGEENREERALEERLFTRLCSFLEGRMGPRRCPTPVVSPSVQPMGAGISSQLSSTDSGNGKGKANKKKKKKAEEVAEEDGRKKKRERAAVAVAANAAEEPIRHQETWAQVVGRRERQKERASAPSTSTAVKRTAATAGKAKAGENKKTAKETKRKPLPARPPRSAAVTVTVPPGATTTYEEVLRKATTSIKLSEMGIPRLRPRPAVNGGLILEVIGQDGAAKAESLAAKMTEVLEGTGARVARPIKKAELRVRGLIPSISPADVAAAVAEIGGCGVGEVQTGEIRRASSGLGTLWIRCPAATARKVAVLKKITVGWIEATVEALQARPLQCYKCLEVGHTREQCPSETDRSGRCYNCGDPSHKASTCTASPKCPVCSDKGRPAGHRLGGRACKHNADKKKNKGGKTKDGAKAAVPQPSAVVTPTATTATAKEPVAPQPPTDGPVGLEGDRMITE